MLFVFLSSIALARALTLNAPNDWQVGSNNTLTWTAAAGDPASFSVELLQPQLLNGPLAIIDQANTSDSSATFNLPEVPPGSGYTLEAVGIANISNVLATSDSFSIALAPSPTTSTMVSASTVETDTTSSSLNTVPPANTPTTTSLQTASSPTPTQTGSASARTVSVTDLVRYATAGSVLALATLFVF